MISLCRIATDKHPEINLVGAHWARSARRAFWRDHHNASQHLIIAWYSNGSNLEQIRQHELRQMMPASLRLKANGKSLSDQAYNRIRNEILSGDLLIGDMLSRRRLADRLNMSFLPITEALKRLETEGLVESRPRIGTRVRIPTEQDIRDSNVIREALESQAARLCAERITGEEKKQLLTSAQHLDELQALCAKESVDSRFLVSVHTYHMEFHIRIANLSRCPGLCRAIEKEQVLIFNWLYDVAANRRTLPPRFHLTLAEALCSNDSQQADAAMRAHVRYGLDQVLERLANRGDIDHWKREKRR